MSDIQAHFDQLTLDAPNHLAYNGNYHPIRKQRSQRFTVHTQNGQFNQHQQQQQFIPPVPSLPYSPSSNMLTTSHLAPPTNHNEFYSPQFSRLTNNGPESGSSARSGYSSPAMAPSLSQNSSASSNPYPDDYNPATNAFHRANYQQNYSANQIYPTQQIPASQNYMNGYTAPGYLSPTENAATAYPSPANSFQRTNLHPDQNVSGVRAGLPSEWITGIQNSNIPDDQVIPTAIVIKNIPFQVPKENLLGLMQNLRLPAPFAFNYHVDQGQFRGLAFANYRLPAEANLTVTALDGYNLLGRKLRAEFKKVLKEGEKEKIERDKAIKRMKSTQGFPMHSDLLGAPSGWNRREASAPSGYMSHAAAEEEDYGKPLYGQFSAAFSAGKTFGSREFIPAPTSMTFSQSEGMYPISNITGYSTSPPSSEVGTSVSARMLSSSSHSAGSENLARSSAGGELNLNDAGTLEIYSRVLLFKDDSLRDELSFARSLSPQQRRTVHLVAQKLGLTHKSIGEGQDRHVVVSKIVTSPEPAARTLRHHNSTLGRQASREMLSNYSNPPASNPSRQNLRPKKSMPEIRATHPTSRRHQLSGVTREGYATVSGVSRRQVPSVQGLFQQNGIYENGNANESNSANPATEQANPSPTPVAPISGYAVRQPKGPDSNETSGWRRSVAESVHE